MCHSQEHSQKPRAVPFLKDKPVKVSVCLYYEYIVNKYCIQFYIWLFIFTRHWMRLNKIVFVAWWDQPCYMLLVCMSERLYPTGETHVAAGLWSYLKNLTREETAGKLGENEIIAIQHLQLVIHISQTLWSFWFCPWHTADLIQSDHQPETLSLHSLLLRSVSWSCSL